MNVLDMAISLKQEKEQYYRQLALRGGSRGVSELFLLLADEEARHGKAIEEMRDLIGYQLPRSTVLTGARRIFEQMEERDEKPEYANYQLQMYEKALNYEDKSREALARASEEVHDSCQKEMLSHLAQEELTHKMLIETIINFVSKPERWLENAEWYHLEEY